MLAAAWIQIQSGKSLPHRAVLKTKQQFLAKSAHSMRVISYFLPKNALAPVPSKGHTALTIRS